MKGFFVAERFNRTKFTSICLHYQKMSILINYMAYNKCNNTYHSTITMKPIDVKWSKYINFGVKNNEKRS